MLEALRSGLVCGIVSVLLIAINALVVYLGWGILMVPIFHLPHIEYIQACWLCMLVGSLIRCGK